jgi:hypothetical protein
MTAMMDGRSDSCFASPAEAERHPALFAPHTLKEDQTPAIAAVERFQGAVRRCSLKEVKRPYQCGSNAELD